MKGKTGLIIKGSKGNLSLEIYRFGFQGTSIQGRLFGLGKHNSNGVSGQRGLLALFD